MPERIPRRRSFTTACVALLSLLVLVPAAPARADGEDDLSFGDRGVVYTSVPANDWVPPVVDQAPNGDVIAATGAEVTFERGSGCNGSRGVCDDTLFVSRWTGDGTPTGLQGGSGETRLALDGDGVLLDIGGTADGRIVVAGHYFPVEDEERGARTDRDRIALGIIGANGDEVRRETYEAPNSCGAGGSEFPIAAEVVGLVIYVLWANCDANEILAKYDLSRETVSVITEWNLSSFSFDAVDLAVGPGGHVYTLARGNILTRGDDPELSIVEKFTSDLEPVEEYGGFGGIAALQDDPVDFDVDASGRAVVWGGENQLRARGGDSDETVWDVRRLDASGMPDDLYGIDGVATLEGPAFGPIGCVDEHPENCPKLQHMVVMPAGQAVLMGFDDSAFGQQRGFSSAPRTVARLDTAGKLDPRWDGDGVRSFGFTPPESGFLDFVNALALQADGKVLVPFIGEANLGRVPAPDDTGNQMGIARLTHTGQTTPTTTDTGQQPAADGQPAAGAAPQQAARRPCTSRRRFAIRLRTGRRKAERSAIVSATVRVIGRRVAVTRTARRTARVNLTNLPKGRFTVTIRLRLRDGGIVRETRRYRTCAPKVERELAPLRTRAPKSKRGRR